MTKPKRPSLAWSAAALSTFGKMTKEDAQRAQRAAEEVVAAFRITERGNK